MSDKFQIIVTDPPWSFQDKLTMSDVARGAEANYNTLNNNDIAQLNIKELADPDGAILALWVPSSLLEEGVKCINNYGFEIKQTYVWVKIKNEPLKNLFVAIRKRLDVLTALFRPLDAKRLVKEEIDGFCINNNILSFGMGRLFRQTHEICLIGINNKKIYKTLESKSERSVSLHSNDGHSYKPEYLQDSLEAMFPKANKLEMFARRARKDWTCIGNEAPDTLGEDIRDSIKNLL